MLGKILVIFALLFIVVLLFTVIRSADPNWDLEKDTDIHSKFIRWILKK